MANVLAELGRRYDVVLLDAPPLLPVTDAAIIGAACDGALFVVRHGRTTRNQVKAAVAALEAVSVRVLGTVLSMAPESASSPYYEYYSALEETEPDPDLEGTVPIARVAPSGDPKRNGTLTGRLPTETLTQPATPVR